VPGGREQFAGAWAVLGLFAFNALFNSILGEELLFRGVLLPRMKAVFGRWDWLANGVLFGVYHLPSRGACSGSIGSGALLYALPAKRFRSRWVSIILHSGQTLFFTVGDPRAGPGAGLTHRTGSAPRWRSAGQHVSNRPGRRMCHEATAAALARWSCDAEGSLKTVVLAETLTAQPNRARR